MKKEHEFKIRRNRQFGRSIILMIAIAGAISMSCASTPEYPIYPPPTTDILPVGFQEAFTAARSVLRDDPRLVLHTVDTAGRLVAWEKTSSFIFFRHRTILDFVLQQVGPEQTKITMYLSAENYEMGGLTRTAGWYPSADVDTFLGEDVLDLIRERAEQAAVETESQPGRDDLSGKVD